MLLWGIMDEAIDRDERLVSTTLPPRNATDTVALANSNCTKKTNFACAAVLSRRFMEPIEVTGTSVTRGDG